MKRNEMTWSGTDYIWDGTDYIWGGLLRVGVLILDQMPVENLTKDYEQQ